MTKLPTNEPPDRPSIADKAPLRLADAARLASLAGAYPLPACALRNTRLSTLPDR
jgi:hypothetical protein